MNLQGSIQTPPEIPVLDGNHLAVALPVPIVCSPIVQTVPDSPPNIVALGEERDTGRQIDGLKTSHDGEQFQAFALDRRLRVFYLYFRMAIGCLKQEMPVARLAVFAALGLEQEMGGKHCQFPDSKADCGG